MKVISGIDKLESAGLLESAATLGTFDGVHNGHRQIIANLLEVSRKGNLHPVLVTFDPHPQMVLGTRGPIEILTTLDEKLDLLKDTGIETVVVLEFNRQLASFPPQQFVKDILMDKLGMKALIIGFDHAFGKNREGNKELLASMAKKEGFHFVVVPEFKIDGQIIKSTAIRYELKNGDYALAKRALGYNYLISGKIIHGHGIGKTLGYPTINLAVQAGKLLPKQGVYSAKAAIDGKKYDGMTYIGERLTFDDTSLVVEINLFDFKNEPQFDHATIELIDYIRPPEKFETAAKLVEKIKNDEVEIKKRFKY